MFHMHSPFNDYDYWPSFCDLEDWWAVSNAGSLESSEALQAAVHAH